MYAQAPYDILTFWLLQLQVPFMPTELKPPMNTLAGFLKGGRLFGEGAIET